MIFMRVEVGVATFVASALLSLQDIAEKRTHHGAGRAGARRGRAGGSSSAEWRAKVAAARNPRRTEFSPWRNGAQAAQRMQTVHFFFVQHVVAGVKGILSCFACARVFTRKVEWGQGMGSRWKVQWKVGGIPVRQNVVRDKGKKCAGESHVCGARKVPRVVGTAGQAVRNQA